MNVASIKKGFSLSLNAFTRLSLKSIKQAEENKKTIDWLYRD